MAKLIVGGVTYPLVMTVGVLDGMGKLGIDIQGIPGYFSPGQHPMEEAIDNGLDFLRRLMEAGQEISVFRDGAEALPLPDPALLRLILSPGQVWGLCDAAITDSLVRTVEAAPGKKQAAVSESP